FEITYVGGCPRELSTFQWYAGSELVCNDGGLGDPGNPDNLIWNADPTGSLGSIIYDGGFFVVADEPIVRRTFFDVRNEFIPDLTPTGICGFDEYHDVPLGTYRSGGIPGTPVTITGDVIVSSYIDTNVNATPGTPEAAIGLDITQTEIGAHDALYGDFKLIRWQLRERNGNALSDLHAGSFIDWDAPPDYGANLAALWPHTVNGYAIWDENTPSYAYGMLDPHQYALYINVDPTAHPVHGIAGIDHNGRGIDPGSPESFWDAVVNMSSTFVNDGTGDRAVMLTHQAFDIPPYGTTAIHQALYGMPALNGWVDQALMEAQAMSIAARAARWGGFARGDVNDDGRVDLGDVLWLVLGYPIYPDDYCGDVNIDGIVDQADIDQLMAWVSGDHTAQPRGEWRFEF
ncbi:MAG TPA: hypothetical protein VM118_01315, partial [Acidobacteriota bacterium]|nr:hypothetical protein [Acidobacteriota bacterium]